MMTWSFHILSKRGYIPKGCWNWQHQAGIDRNSEVRFGELNSTVVYERSRRR